MDTRQTPAERAAAERAVKDDAARADAMKQSAALHARDAGTATAVESRKAAAERARRRPALVGPLTARLAVENEALAIEERAAARLDEFEAKVGDSEIWWILTQVFRPDSLLRLCAQCEAAVAKHEAEVKATEPEEKVASKSATATAVAPPEVVADPAENTFQRFISAAIVEATRSNNRP